MMRLGFQKERQGNGKQSLERKEKTDGAIQTLSGD